MEYIVKKDGYVYQVTEHDVYGKHRTTICLGREYTKDTEDSERQKKKKKDEA